MITVTNVTKKFGPKTAVNNLSFTVQKGEVLGFLGPNGAGKSTTMRMITGYLPVSEGKITVGGFDIATHPIEAKRLIGYLPENAPSYPDMTVGDFLHFSAEIRGLSKSEADKAVEKAIALCFLESVQHQGIDTLSKGYRHRTCLAQSIIHDPPILILDEPTDGLDPNQKRVIRSLIKRMGAEKCIIFSTHILEEVEAVCSRAVIIDRGQIVANGTPEELELKDANAGLLAVTLAKAEKDSAQRELAALPGVRKISLADKSAGDSLTFQLLGRKDKKRDEELAAAVADLAAKKGWRLQQLAFTEGRLDNVFAALTKQETDKSAE